MWMCFPFLPAWGFMVCRDLAVLSLLAVQDAFRGTHSCQLWLLPVFIMLLHALLF